MSVKLRSGESYSLTTGRVTRDSVSRDPMDRPVRSAAGNDLRALYASLRKANRS